MLVRVVNNWESFHWLSCHATCHGQENLHSVLPIPSCPSIIVAWGHEIGSDRIFNDVHPAIGSIFEIS